MATNNVNGSADTDPFSINNIPYGVAKTATSATPGIVTRYHDHVYFISDLIHGGFLKEVGEEGEHALAQPTLNEFAASSKETQRQVRSALQAFFRDTLSGISSEATKSWQVPAGDVTMVLPVSVGDFSDYLCSKDHILNCSEVLGRGRELPRNFLSYPIAYTGKAGSVVVSGTDVVRPRGLIRQPATSDEIKLSECHQLDFELEIACVIGRGSTMGEPVPITEADDHIFGLVLLNDWSARDLQMTEALPLGPFCCKSFATSISPWIITLDALQPHMTPGPPRDLPVPPHLADPDPQRYRVSVKSEIYNPKTGEATTISQSRLETIYWSFRDMIAHHTSNGYPLRAGDILAAGTVSNEPVGTHSCLLEVSRHGTRAFELGDGSTRTYLADGDAVRLTAWGEQGGVGFGECVGTILPAKKLAQV